MLHARESNSPKNSGCGACIFGDDGEQCRSDAPPSGGTADMPIAGTPMMDLPVMGGEPSGALRTRVQVWGPGSV